MKLTTGKIIDDWGRTEMTAYIPLRIEAWEQNVTLEPHGAGAIRGTEAH